MSNTEKVRIFFEKMRTSTAAAAARALGLRGTQASCAVRELLERGWLKRVDGCQGIYEFHQLKEHEFGRAVKIQEKIWRAVRIAKNFTAWEIALYSGANLDHVREYLRFLQRKGLIKPEGRQGMKAIYRCQENPQTETPVMRSLSNRKAVRLEDLQEIGWSLMRALQGGELDQARELCERLRTELAK